MPTRISGLGSGLDINAIVQQAMQAKRIPIDQMKQKVTYLGWQRDAYRDMNTEMSNFLKEVQKLTLESSVLAKKASLSAADADKVKAAPSASAVNGNFTLDVTQIAKSASIISSALGVSANPTVALAPADATLRVKGTTGEKQVEITSGDNINQIVSKINGVTSQTGVKAIYDQLSDKLTLVNTQTGSDGNIKLEIEDLDSTGLLFNQLHITTALSPDLTDPATNGQDAIVDFNNTGAVTIASNSFTLNNINFTLLKDPDGAPYSISGSINTDVDTAVSTIKGVFDKYNEIIAKVNSKLSEPKYRDYLPLTDTQKENMKDSEIKLWDDKAKSGLLRGDSILRAGLEKMRRFLSDSVSGIGAGQYDSLEDIGITTAPSNGVSTSQAYRENGKIYINEDKLRIALTNSPDQVAALFTKDGARDANNRLTSWADAGIGTRLYEIVNIDLINGLTEKTQIIPTRSYLNRQIDDYSSRIVLAESGLSTYEQDLYSRYAKMEKALNNLNSQGSSLASFFQKQ